MFTVEFIRGQAKKFRSTDRSVFQQPTAIYSATYSFKVHMTRNFLLAYLKELSKL
mgnify:CR=1 FL=1